MNEAVARRWRIDADAPERHLGRFRLRCDLFRRTIVKPNQPERRRLRRLFGEWTTRRSAPHRTPLCW